MSKKAQLDKDDDVDHLDTDRTFVGGKLHPTHYYAQNTAAEIGDHALVAKGGCAYAVLFFNQALHSPRSHVNVDLVASLDSAYRCPIFLLLTVLMRLSLAHSFLSLVIPLTPSRDCRWLLDKCKAVRPVRPFSPSVVSKPHSVILRLSKPVKGST